MQHRINFHSADWLNTKKRLNERRSELRDMLEDSKLSHIDTQLVRGEIKAINEILYWELEVPPPSAG